MDVQVLRFESLLGVEHQDADVGVLDGANRPHDGVEFEVLGHLALLAHTGRVDQVEVHAEFVVARVDRVARGAGHRSHDIALDTQQGVGERRFAHVGAADDGDARQIVLVLRRSFGGQRLQDGVHQVARTASRHRRDAVGVAQPELVELVRGVDLIVVVDFVADQDDLLRGAAQDVGHERVEVGDARRHLHQKEDHVRLVDGEHHLPADVVFENIVRIDRITARVDHGKLLAVPIGFAVMAVAGRAGRGVHDGLTLSHQTVEECAFAHVGATDYRYQTHNVEEFIQRLHSIAGHIPCRMARAFFQAAKVR